MQHLTSLLGFGKVVKIEGSRPANMLLMLRGRGGGDDDGLVRQTGALQWQFILVSC